MAGKLVAREVYIPQLGQTVEQVTLVHWLVPDHAQVKEGDGILEVETDKAIFTVEAAGDGTLHYGPYQEGDIVPVLTVVAIIGKSEDRFTAITPMATQTAEVESSPQSTDARPGQSVDGARESPGAGKVFASPRARWMAATKNVDLKRVIPTGGEGQRVAERDVLAYLDQLPRITPVAQRLATEEGVDLRILSGSGPGGRITKEDVKRAISSPVPTPASPADEVVERVPLIGVRGIIADRMATIAHATARVTLLIEADATQFVALRERLKARVAEEWGFAPGYNDLLAKIVASGLRKFTYMNSRLTSDAIERLAHINLGMATDTERGLLVQVIRQADKKSLRQFGIEFRELVERARNAKSLPDDLTGGTFTITNLGMYDILAFTPVINLPEAAILGVGRITPRPVARNEQVEVRQILILSLAFDHRLVDGAPAARFLQYIKDAVEEPDLWLAEQI